MRARCVSIAPLASPPVPDVYMTTASDSPPCGAAARPRPTRTPAVRRTTLRPGRPADDHPGTSGSVCRRPSPLCSGRRPRARRPTCSASWLDLRGGERRVDRHDNGAGAQCAEVARSRTPGGCPGRDRLGRREPCPGPQARRACVGRAVDVRPGHPGGADHQCWVVRTRRAAARGRGTPRGAWGVHSSHRLSLAQSVSTLRPTSGRLADPRCPVGRITRTRPIRVTERSSRRAEAPTPRGEPRREW